MIVVLGRPGLTAEDGLNRLAGRIALAAATERGRVELVGSVGDDADGDTVVVALGSAGIGHAAMLRDPAGETPRGDASDTAESRLPRLDAGDIDLGLRYLADFRVLVVAEPLSEDALRVAIDAAAYHDAALVVLTPSETAKPAAAKPAAAKPAAELPDSATVLAVPPDDGGAFAALVARYALALDSGRPPADAWRDAIDETGWEQAAE